ncbi:hypothetical protein D7V60_02305 [Escherichia coli]|nr:hypothetical protein [Escherichia coli]EFC1992855.1 hypothetical protein [Escherichia coli]
MLRFLTEWLSKRCVNIIDMYQICFVTRQCLVNINKKPSAMAGLRLMAGFVHLGHLELYFCSFWPVANNFDMARVFQLLE